MTTTAKEKNQILLHGHHAASLFLRERKMLLGSLFNCSADSNKEKCKEAAERWRHEALLLDDKQFMARLDADNWTEEQFAELIGAEPADQQESITLPRQHHLKDEWIGIEELTEALELNRSIPLRGPAVFKMVSAFRPFLLWAAKQWDEHLTNHGGIASYMDSEALRDNLLNDLAECLLQIGARTLVLELHIAKKLEELEGNTPEARFQSFIRKKLMDCNSLEFIYKEYPLLARMLMIRTQYIVRAVLEAVDRFAADYPVLAEALGFSRNINRLCAFSGGKGDAHQQGRTVMRLRLESGLELMYKPKPLGVSLHFSQLLEWMNRKGFSPAFRPLTVIDRGDYGWEECINPQDCDNQTQVSRFYYRLGGLLAIIYGIRGADFHMENVIAQGEHPIPIDLETIFHNAPRLEFPDTADVAAKKRIVESVIGTGLLPILIFQNEDGTGVELSGLGGGQEQILPFPVLQVENEETDEMRFVRKEKKVGAASNRPMLNRQDINPADYVDDIVAGFRSACSIIRQHLAELTEEHSGPLARFRNDTIRIILRPTQFYANFLMESHHPNYTKDAIQREKLLDRLYYTVLDNRAIASEREDLMLGDIPYFTTTPCSRDLLDSHRKAIPQFFPSDSYSLVLQRLNQLDESEEERQANWIISSVLGSADWKSGKSSCCPSAQTLVLESGTHSESNMEDHTKLSAEFVNQAAEIGDFLLQEAIYSISRQDVSWIGAGMNYQGQWSISAMKGGLYDGTAGPALFLAYLGYLTGEAAYSETAALALQTSVASLPYHTHFGSAFYGQASVLYVLTQLERLGIIRPEWDGLSDSLIRQLDSIAFHDRYYDVLGGAAGIIPVLLGAYRHSGNNQALEAAVKYGEHLVRHAVPAAEGKAWPSLLQSRKPLGGFAHGASGISWALQLLYGETGTAAYRELAEAAFAFERSLFSSEYGNWTDLRKEGDEAFGSNFWCHGSAGIGLSLAAALQGQIGCRKSLLAELDAAIAAVRKNGIGASHCLCHGDMGNSELLLQSGLILERPEYIESARALGQQVIRQKQQTGYYRTGIPRGLRTPGFFLGYSGIGYQLLRLAQPERVPSVLTLQVCAGRPVPASVSRQH